jgi:glycosyltransferase involved in cell wall biosynthesis
MLNWRDPHNPKAGGAERVTQKYLSALVRRGHEAFWFANDFPGAAREEVIDSITVIRGGGYGSSVLEAIKWYRRQPRFDLVVDQHHGIPWYAPWWCRTHHIAYIHEVLGPIWTAFYSWPKSVIGQRQEVWTHWLYRRVPFWTPSESTRKELLATGVRQVQVFPNGVDTRPLPALDPKPLGLPLRLVAVSRLAPNKRIDHGIRAVRVLKDRGVAVALRVVGGGEDESRLRRLVSETGLGAEVHFTGPVSEADKEKELRDAHFLVHTSIREGWGLNVIEANAMGTPAVVYPVGGLVDSTVSGHTGIVVAEETPACVADALQEALKSPPQYEAFRQNAWKRAQSLQWDEVLPPACEWLESQARGGNSSR